MNNVLDGIRLSPVAGRQWIRHEKGSDYCAPDGALWSIYFRAMSGMDIGVT